MEILEDLGDVISVVDEKAKYQKVMVIFDNSLSSVEIDNLYREIKDICIFNKSAVEDLDLNELNNGYRAIIYMCSAESFLKLDFNRDEFINIYLPTDNIFLPFCLNENNNIKKGEDYILCENIIDVSVQTSLLFNKFYHYLYNTILSTSNQTSFYFENNFTRTSINYLIDESCNLDFVDIKILKNINIEYKNLQVLHLLLIDAFLIFLTNVKNKTLMLVDVYKSCKEDYNLIDKFYAMANSESSLMLISLNYNYLYNACLKTKESILNCCFNMNEEEIENVLLELKSFAKNDDGLVGYLYLYNMFNV